MFPNGFNKGPYILIFFLRVSLANPGADGLRRASAGIPGLSPDAALQ